MGLYTEQTYDEKEDTWYPNTLVIDYQGLRAYANPPELVEKQPVSWGEDSSPDDLSFPAFQHHYSYIKGRYNKSNIFLA